MVLFSMISLDTFSVVSVSVMFKVVIVVLSVIFVTLTVVSVTLTVTSVFITGSVMDMSLDIVGCSVLGSDVGGVAVYYKTNVREHGHK